MRIRPSGSSCTVCGPVVVLERRPAALFAFLAVRRRTMQSKRQCPSDRHGDGRSLSSHADPVANRVRTSLALKSGKGDMALPGIARKSAGATGTSRRLRTFLTATARITSRLPVRRPITSAWREGAGNPGPHYPRSTAGQGSPQPPDLRFLWGERWDSNPRHPGPQPGALPAELRPPWPRRCAGRLREAYRDQVTGQNRYLPARRGRPRATGQPCPPARPG
jgi:hypothetical protein